MAPLDVSDIGDVKVLRKPDGGDVYILGSCHVSDSSASEAESLVRRVRPSAVVLELCNARRGLLTESDDNGGGQASDVSQQSITSTATASNTSLAEVASSMGNVLTDWTQLIKMQYSALDGLEAPKAGAEFRAAAREAEAVGAHVVLGDRSVNTTTLRLKRLIPYSELVLAMLFDDSEWIEKCALERHSAMEELQRTSGALQSTLEQPASELRETKLRALSAQLALQTEAAVEAAVPSFSDAVMSGLLRRFWCKEVIGDEDKARLRRALNAMHRMDPLSGATSLPPTMRRILIAERDVVLCEALKKAPGERVVGVVGKAHVAGIARLWDTDTASGLQACLEEPRPSVLPLVAVATCGLGLPYAAYRSRAVRLGLGGCGLIGAGAAAYLAVALRDRINFYQRSQQELAALSRARGAQQPAG